MKNAKEDCVIMKDGTMMMIKNGDKCYMDGGMMKMGEMKM